MCQKVRCFTMLLEIIMIPFLLGFNVNLPEEEKLNNPEYSYELKKTNSTLRDSVRQTDQLTCTVTCHTFNVTDLYCFLYNVVFLSTKIYSNFTYVTSDKHIKSEQWFQIKFNSHGVQKVLVHQTIDERVKNIIQDIVNQFNIGVEPMSNLMSVGLFRNIFTVKENVPIGSCATTYTLQTLLSPELVIFNSTGHPQENKDDGVIVYALPMHYGYQTGTYVLINKKRTNCSSSMEFFNGMDIVEYKHVIEAHNNNVRTSLNIQTVLHTRQPVFKEITQLNLTSIKFPRTEVFDTSYIWVDM